MIGFGDMSSRYRFIGVAPSGRLDGTTPYWLAAPSVDNYDLTFINDLLDVLEAKLCVDPRRIYSTGMSNGAQMSSLLACRLANRITAVAPVAGVEFYDTCRGRPVPVIAFHGTADPIVTYAGGGLNATRIADLQFWKGNVPAGPAACITGSTRRCKRGPPTTIAAASRWRCGSPPRFDDGPGGTAEPPPSCTSSTAAATPGQANRCRPSSSSSDTPRRRSTRRG